MMRVRIYLSRYDIRDAYRRRSDFESDVEVSVNDVQYIDVNELIRLIRANPEYIPYLKTFLEKFGDE
jgi:hypothetical protein